jgi:hypothetical protein
MLLRFELPEVRNFAPRLVEQTVSAVQLFQELGIRLVAPLSSAIRCR